MSFLADIKNRSFPDNPALANLLEQEWQKHESNPHDEIDVQAIMNSAGKLSYDEQILLNKFSDRISAGNPKKTRNLERAIMLAQIDRERSFTNLHQRFRKLNNTGDGLMLVGLFPSMIIAANPPVGLVGLAMFTAGLGLKEVAFKREDKIKLAYGVND